MGKYKDITNERFGWATAISYAYTDKNSHQAMWNCICDCGSIITTRGNALRNENVISCGCVKSKGEYQLAQLLTQYNINFIHDRVYFNDLLSPKQQALRYDFILLNKDIPYGLIEYDGLQHSQYIEFFDETITDWQYRKLCDDIKTNYAEMHHLPLLRISTINEQELKDWLVQIKDTL